MATVFTADSLLFQETGEELLFLGSRPIEIYAGDGLDYGFVGDDDDLLIVDRAAGTALPIDDLDAVEFSRAGEAGAVATVYAGFTSDRLAGADITYAVRVSGPSLVFPPTGIEGCLEAQEITDRLLTELAGTPFSAGEAADLAAFADTDGGADLPVIAYTAEALVFTGEDGEVFGGETALRFRTDIPAVEIGDIDSDVLVEDLGRGTVFTIDDTEVFEITFTVDGQSRQAVFLDLDFDGRPGGVANYSVQISGDPVPLPAPGADVEAFLAGIVTGERELSEIPGNRFEEGRAVPFDAIDGIAAIGPVGQGIGEARARLVAYLYEAGLDRNGAIDEPGLNFWIDEAERGLNNRQIAGAFIASEEFRDSFGDPAALDDAAFVTVLFENVLERAPDPGGLGFWLGELEQTGDRRELLLAFATSPENVAGSAFVETLAEVEPGTWAFLG